MSAAAGYEAYDGTCLTPLPAADLPAPPPRRTRRRPLVGGTTVSTMPVTIGTYRIESVLGHGAMGVVYRGHDPVLDRTVAIKTIRAELIAAGDDGFEDDDWHARFRHEARAAARCTHPNIVTIYDFGETPDGSPYLVMEFVEGRELRRHLGEGRQFDLPAAALILRQILRALDCAHLLGIVHRDIKPANVILLADGMVKVTDFGIARLSGGTGLTQTGAMVGTPNYMSPEQFTGGTLDRRADLYACAVIAYELLTGQRPYPGPTPPALLHQILNTTPPRPSALRPSLPAALDAVLLRGLARDPGARFADACEFQRALDAALAPALAPVPIHHHPEPGTVVMPAPLTLSDAELHEAETTLATHIGPLARVLVRRAAASAHSRDAWLEEIARNISDDDERRRFLRRLRRGEPTGYTQYGTTAHTAHTGHVGHAGGNAAPTAASGYGSSGSVTTVLRVDAATLATAQQALTQAIGPIARVLVRQTAPLAQDAADLYRRLAERIDDADARRRFLATRPH